MPPRTSASRLAEEVHRLAEEVHRPAVAPTQAAVAPRLAEEVHRLAELSPAVPLAVALVEALADKAQVEQVHPRPVETACLNLGSGPCAPCPVEQVHPRPCAPCPCPGTNATPNCHKAARPCPEPWEWPWLRRTAPSPSEETANRRSNNLWSCASLSIRN